MFSSRINDSDQPVHGTHFDVTTGTGTCAALRTHILYDVGHRHDGTNNKVCWRSLESGSLGTPSTMNSDHVGTPRSYWPGDSDFEYCGTPGNGHSWRPTNQMMNTFCTDYGGGSQAWTEIEINGGDAMIIDQIVIEGCRVTENALGTCMLWQDYAFHRIGGNNDVGWCLSTDSDDWSYFGHHAYMDRCSNKIWIKPMTGEWMWGH